MSIEDPWQSIWKYSRKHGITAVIDTLRLATPFPIFSFTEKAGPAYYTATVVIRAFKTLVTLQKIALA